MTEFITISVFLLLLTAIYVCFKVYFLTKKVNKIEFEFKNNVIKSIKDWTGYEDPFMAIQKSERELFQMLNPLPSFSSFKDVKGVSYEVENAWHKVLMKGHGVTTSIEKDTFYNMWFDGKITRVG